MKRKINNDKLRRRKRRAFSIRKRIEGTAECPRLSVFRSARHIYAQLVDDIAGTTIVSASTLTKGVKAENTDKKKSEIAVLVGKTVGEAAAAKGIAKVVFDRNGYPYHGRVAAVAKGAREAGLKF